MISRSLEENVTVFDGLFRLVAEVFAVLAGTVGFVLFVLVACLLVWVLGLWCVCWKEE